MHDSGKYHGLLQRYSALDEKDRLSENMLTYKGFAQAYTEQYDSVLVTLRLAQSKDSLGHDANLGLGLTFRKLGLFDSPMQYSLRCTDLKPEMRRL